MKRASAALFLSLSSLGLLAACAPAALPQKVFLDSYYASSVNDQASYYDGRGWVYEAPGYSLRYWLGTHPEGTAPGSVKLELTTTEPVRVAWKDSRFIYESGDTSPITHEGVRYGEQPTDTELSAQDSLSDRVVPQKNLVFSGGQVVGFRYLTEPEAFGTDSFALELILNGEPLLIRLDGNRD